MRPRRRIPPIEQATGALFSLEIMADPTESDHKPPLSLDVRCYSGYRGEQEPRRLLLGQREVVVLEIIDRWLAPDHRYFKVQGDDGAVYILRHDETSGRWEIIMYDSGRR